MKKLKVLLKSGRGNSGNYDLTITISPDQLKNPLLDEDWAETPKGLGHNPLYDNKAILEQPVYNPDRDISRAQIVKPAVNRKLKYSKVFLRSDMTVMVDDEPNQWGLDDGTNYWDDLAKNSPKSIKNYAPEQNEIQFDPKVYQTKNDSRVLHHDTRLDDKKRNSKSAISHKDEDKTYNGERVRNPKYPRFQEDAFHLMDDKAPSSDKSQRNSSPRLSNNKNIL